MSFEALVARDTNGAEDVYQWQAPGSGECTTQSPAYSAANGGCLSLISSGQSPQGSELVDISADGRDVFFKTGESLVAQDSGLIDVYDARALGGFPPPPIPPAPCEGEACAPPAAAPNDPSPASASFQGAGNEPQGKPNRPRPCPKGKRRVKRAGKVRCVRAKRKAKRQSTKGRARR
jgi:hypothetical protein